MTDVTDEPEVAWTWIETKPPRRAILFAAREPGASVTSTAPRAPKPIVFVATFREMPSWLASAAPMRSLIVVDWFSGPVTMATTLSVFRRVESWTRSGRLVSCAIMALRGEIAAATASEIAPLAGFDGVSAGDVNAADRPRTPS